METELCWRGVLTAGLSGQIQRNPHNSSWGQCMQGKISRTGENKSALLLHESLSLRPAVTLLLRCLSGEGRPTVGVCGGLKRKNTKTIIFSESGQDFLYFVLFLWIFLSFLFSYSLFIPYFHFFLPSAFLSFLLPLLPCYWYSRKELFFLFWSFWGLNSCRWVKMAAVVLVSAMQNQAGL